MVCCGECYHLFMFGNGFPSRFDHFSFVASLSFRVWPAEVPHHWSWATVCNEQDARAESRKDPQKSKKTRLPTARAHTQTGPEKASALSVIIAHLWALKVFARAVSQCSNFRAASCHCVTPCPCFASCDCCHDPFIVRSAQT